MSIASVSGQSYGTQVTGAAYYSDANSSGHAATSKVQSVDDTVTTTLDADLGAAATNPNDEAAAIAALLKSATSVDPATGHREITAGAAEKMAAAVNQLLVQNGFDPDRANAATANLARELTQGGKISLSASIAKSTQETTDTSASSSAALSTLSSSLGINLDLDSGALSVTVKQNTAYTYVTNSTGAPTGGFAYGGGIGFSTENLATSVTDTLSAALAYKSDQVANAIQQLARIANDMQLQTGTAPVEDAATVLAGGVKKNAHVATVPVGIAQTVALHQRGKDGSGATLYKRPDGSLGTFPTTPHRLTA